MRWVQRIVSFGVGCAIGILFHYWCSTASACRFSRSSTWRFEPVVNQHGWVARPERSEGRG